MQKRGAKYLSISLLGLVAWLLASNTTAQTSAKQVNALLQASDQFLERGKFLDALQKAFEAKGSLPISNATQDTTAAETYLQISRCYGALYERPRAILYLDSARAFLGAAQLSVYYAIEHQLGLRKNDPSRIHSALAYYRNKDLRQYAECLLSLGSLGLTSKAPKVPEELRECLALLEKQGLAESSATGRCNMLLGYYYWRNANQYDQALDYFKASESAFVKTGGDQNGYLAVLYVNMGACLDDIGLPRKAIALYEKAVEIFIGLNKKHPNLGSVYNNFGRSLSDLGEYAASIQYLEKAKALDPENGRYWNNLGDAYLSRGEYPMAESCFEKAKQLLLASEKKNLPEIARPYHNLAVIYRQRGQLDSALAYELRSLPYRKSDSTALLDIARSYLGTGECYAALGKYVESLLYLDSALWLQGRKLPSHQYPETSNAYAAKAKVKAALGDYRAALVLIDSALYATGYSGKGVWNEVSAPPELLSALEQKAALYYGFFEKSHQEAPLLAAVQCYDTAVQAIRFFRNTLLDSESKATLAGQFRGILSGGLEAALALHQLRPEKDTYLRLAFAFTEQSKALVLLEGVRSAGTLKFEGISDSLLDRERSLRQAVTDAEAGLRKRLARGSAGGDSLVAKARNELFERQRAFEAFQRILATGENARYYNFRYGLSLATPEEIQAQLLDPKRSLVSYFVGKKGRITAFVIQKNGFQAIECPGGESLDEQVQALREGLFGYYTLPSKKRSDALYTKSLDQYVSAARALYNILIAPLESLLGEEVVIVPDGILSYIPFELLLTEMPAQPANFSEYPYWFRAKNHSVSYAYSATLLREMTQKQHRKKTSRTLLAMAPFYPGTRADLAAAPGNGALDENRKGLNPLVYSGQEVRDINRIWGSDDFWVGKEASKRVFLQFAPDCQMLHLSTHGVLDSAADFSYLAFAASTAEEPSEPLFVRDLYSLQLNADLVTLSACETGVGKLQAGEGVISLARAFAYAGAKSIFTSLWQVNDAATKDLMICFYKNLKAGNSKDWALRKAKLEYLKTHAGERAHPFFWAGIVGVGAMSAIEIP